MNWLDWGYPVLLWFQGLGDSLLLPMQAFTALGNEFFFMLVMPGLLWCYDARLGIEIGGLLLFSSSINGIAKMITALPRPYWANPAVHAVEGGSGFGFPSGHAQNALVMWGQLAVRIRRRWVTWLCVALIFMISISRWYLGLHFPLDTLGGWIIGIAILVLYARLHTTIQRSLEPLSSGMKIILSFNVALMLVLAGWVLSTQRIAPADLSLWERTAQEALPDAERIQPFAMDPVISSAGSWFGVMAGGVLLAAWNGYKMKGSLGQYLLRILLGITGLLVIYLGLKSVFPTDASAATHALRFLRYALLGFWISYLAPRLFMRLRLFQPAG